MPRPRNDELRRLLERGTTDHYEDPALYDYEYSDRTDDMRWYRRLARERADGKILELGAGSGRISCPLASDGHRVTALDAMEPMLDALRQRAERTGLLDRIEPVLGDMTRLPFDDESFALVIAPFNALMHLYAWQDLLACLSEARRVLQPGGVLAFDVELPDIEWLTWDPEERHAVTPFVHPTTREHLIYSTNHTYDPGTQICHVRIYYDDAPPPGQRFEPPDHPRKLVHLAHRQIYPEEVRCLVAQAGLTLESLTGDFIGISLRNGVQSQVVVAVRDP